MKIQTKVFHIKADAQLLASIDKKVARLKYFFNKISEAQVTLKFEQNNQHSEPIAEVKIKIPNAIIFIKESGKTFERALDKALIALKLQLIRYREKRMSYNISTF